MRHVFTSKQKKWIALYTLCALQLLIIIIYTSLYLMGKAPSIRLDVPFVFFNLLFNATHLYAFFIVAILILLLFSSWHIQSRGKYCLIKRFINTSLIMVFLPILFMSITTHKPSLIPVVGSDSHNSIRLIYLIHEQFRKDKLDVYAIHDSVGIPEYIGISAEGYFYGHEGQMPIAQWIDEQAIITIDSQTFYYRPVTF